MWASRGFLLLFVLFCLLEASAGCSSRVETAVVSEDSTLVYPSRRPGGVNAAITLCRKIGEKSGRPIGAGQAFSLKPDAKVVALVGLENREALGRRDLMFHLEWLSPEGDIVYKKRIDYAAGDSTAALKSSIAIDPDRRSPGRYSFRVYLFRELIAEKRFELRADSTASATAAAVRSTE